MKKTSIVSFLLSANVRNTTQRQENVDSGTRQAISLLKTLLSTLKTPRRKFWVWARTLVIKQAYLEEHFNSISIKGHFVSLVFGYNQSHRPYCEKLSWIYYNDDGKWLIIDEYRN